LYMPGCTFFMIWGGARAGEKGDEPKAAKTRCWGKVAATHVSVDADRGRGAKLPRAPEGGATCSLHGRPPTGGE
jgi:hypothetical protein